MWRYFVVNNRMNKECVITSNKEFGYKGFARGLNNALYPMHVNGTRKYGIRVDFDIDSFFFYIRSMIACQGPQSFLWIYDFFSPFPRLCFLSNFTCIGHTI